VSVRIFIFKQPATGDDVLVNLVIKGQCTHSNDGNKDHENSNVIRKADRRQLRRKQRDDVAVVLDRKGQSATKLHYKSLKAALHLKTFGHFFSESFQVNFPKETFAFDQWYCGIFLHDMT
jgi:hypothetical protein